MYDPREQAITPAPAATVGSHPSIDQFFRDVLTGLGIQPTAGTLKALYAWAQAEGGDTHNNASWNPLNTTQRMPGSSSMNKVGVQAYSSYKDGVQATIKTLTNGRYGNILKAMQHGDPVAVGQAVAQSPWGTGEGVLRVLHAGGGVTGSTQMRGGIGGAGQDFSYASGGAGGSGGTFGARDSGNIPDWSEKDFKSALAQMGFSAAFINSDKSLQKLFHDAVKNKWDSTEFSSALQQTAWYRTRNDSQRSYDQLRYQDPATWNRRNAVTANSLVHAAAAMGFTLDPKRAALLAVTVNRNGSSPDEQQQLLAAEIHYNPKVAYGGTFGQALSDVKQLSEAYTVGVTDQTAGQWAQKVAAGTATTKQYEEYLKQQAVNKFPWLKDQINAGLTVADIASPYKDMMARTLEMDPNSIATDDPTVLKGLQYQDPANSKAGYQAMPLYQYDLHLKQDPRWLKTQNARDSLMDRTIGILKAFGVEAS